MEMFGFTWTHASGHDSSLDDWQNNKEEKGEPKFISFSMTN